MYPYINIWVLLAMGICQAIVHLKHSQWNFPNMLNLLFDCIYIFTFTPLLQTGNVGVGNKAICFI